MSKTNRPTVEYLRQCFRYEDGRLFWLKRPKSHFKTEHRHKGWNTEFAGTEAGTIKTHPRDNSKRCTVCVNGKSIARADVVWALHAKDWSNETIDHKNRECLDDHIDNLREATHSQNCANCRMSKRNTTGYKWVCFIKSKGKYQASIAFQGKRIYFKHHDTAQSAHEAAKAEHRRLFGEYTPDEEET